MGKYAFGVDIGGTTVKMGLFDEEGSLLDKWEIPTDKSNEGAGILPDVADSIRDRIYEKEIDKDDVLGIGVGIPGPVNAEGTVFKAVNLGWGIFNVPKVLNGYLNIPVKAINDANAAAFGEMWRGGGKGYKDLVAVTLGTGVGGGIIVNGQIVTGRNGAGGEIGHIHVEDDEKEQCNCGNTGCLEQFASATGIVRLAKRRLKEDGVPSMLRTDYITAKTVFDAVKSEDPAAVEVAEKFGDYLGKGLAMIAAVTDPEIFVIGGGVSKAGEILFDYICPAYRKYAFPACKNAKFALATLGNEAGIYGAAGLFLA